MIRPKLIFASLCLLALFLGAWFLGGAYLLDRWVEEVAASHSQDAPAELLSESADLVDETVESVSDEVTESTSVEVIQRTVESIDWPSRNPAAHRAKRVEVEPRLLRADLDTIQVGDTLNFELFDGERVSAEVTKTQM